MLLSPMAAKANVGGGDPFLYVQTLNDAVAKYQDQAIEEQRAMQQLQAQQHKIASNPIETIRNLQPLDIFTFRHAPRLFISYDAGISQFDTGIGVTGNGAYLDEQDNMFKLGVGAHLNDFIDAEFFYSKLGTVKLGVTSGTIRRNNGTSLSLNNFQETFNLRTYALGFSVGLPFAIEYQHEYYGFIKPYIKLGPHYWETRAVAHQGALTPVNSDDSGYSVFGGLGIFYKFPRSVFGIRAEYLRFNYDSEDFGENVDVGTAGIVATF